MRMWRVKKQINCTEEVHEKYRGKNISVAVLDTGIFFHPDFSNRILAFQDVVKQNHLMMIAVMELMLPDVSPEMGVYPAGNTPE